MMEPISTNSRVQKTLDRIQTAFHDLVVSKNYDDITVSELCEAAHIGRKTFYMHYASLDDLMENTLLRMTRDYIKRINTLRVPDDVAEITRQFYLYSEEQGIFYEKLVCSEGYRNIGGNLLKKFVFNTWHGSRWFRELSPAKQELLLCFIHGAGSALYKQWVTEGRKIPVEEMVAFATHLLAKGIDGLSELKI